MSCPDWRALNRRRESEPDDSSEWLSALEHLDDCRACQADAPAFDPTLIFRRLPALAAGRDDVESMKRAVSSMRRGETIEHRRRPLSATWLRAAALAAVVLGSLLLRGAGSQSGAVAPAAGVSPATAASEIDLRRMPLIETVDPTYGSIIQVVDDDISVVLVVPSEVDV